MFDLYGCLSDLRFALRLLRRSPEVTIIAVAAMAIAIGAASTVFSVVDAVLIQPLPFAQPSRLVAMWQVDPANSSLWHPAAAGKANGHLGRAADARGSAADAARPRWPFA